MGYALGGGRGGGRGGGLLWLLAATGVAALMAGHLTTLPALGPLRAVTATVHQGATEPSRAVHLAYRDADGRWQVRWARATGSWSTASAATWRQAMPGMRVRTDGPAIDLTEALRPTADPYYLGIDRGRVAIWAGRPDGYHLRISTTPLLAGALGGAELARLSTTVRVASVSDAWRVLSGMGT